MRRDPSRCSQISRLELIVFCVGQGFSVHCVKLCVAAIVCAGSRWLWTQDPSASLALSCSYLCRVLRVSLCIGVCCLFHTLALSRSATRRSVQKTCLSRLPCSISWCLLCLCRRSTCCEEAGASSISTLWCCFSQAALRGLFRRRTRSLFFFCCFSLPTLLTSLALRLSCSVLVCLFTVVFFFHGFLDISTYLLPVRSATSCCMRSWESCCMRSWEHSWQQQLRVLH